MDRWIPWEINGQKNERVEAKCPGKWMCIDIKMDRNPNPGCLLISMLKFSVLLFTNSTQTTRSLFFSGSHEHSQSSLDYWCVVIWLMSALVLTSECLVPQFPHSKSDISFTDCLGMEATDHYSTFYTNTNEGSVDDEINGTGGSASTCATQSQTRCCVQGSSLSTTRRVALKGPRRGLMKNCRIRWKNHALPACSRQVCSPPALLFQQ